MLLPRMKIQTFPKTQSLSRSPKPQTMPSGWDLSGLASGP